MSLASEMSIERQTTVIARGLALIVTTLVMAQAKGGTEADVQRIQDSTYSYIKNGASNQ